MSRIGKMPVEIPAGVKISIEGQSVTAAGPKGNLSLPIHPSLSVKQSDGRLVVERKGDSKEEKALHGLTRALLKNMVRGVKEGYHRDLIVAGMGYRAAKQKNSVVLSVGYSTPVPVEPPPGITLDVEGTNKIVVRGADKQLVGQTAAKIRSVRPPDPYKGKGILYEGERLKLKPGKAGKGAAAKA